MNVYTNMDINKGVICTVSILADLLGDGTV